MFSVVGPTFQSSPVFKSIPQGRHTITVKDNFGCTASEAVNIQYLKQYAIKISPQDTTMCYGEKVPLVLSFENPASVKAIKWSNGEMNKTTFVSPLQNLPMTAAVTDNNGCVINDTAFIRVKAATLVKIALPYRLLLLPITII